MLGEIHNLVLLKESEYGVTVEVSTEFDRLLGLRIHAQETEQTIQRILRRALQSNGRPDGAHRVIFSLAERDSAFALAEVLKQRMQKIASRSIDRRHVERILRITRSECSRWTKDGRLPRQGNLIINRGRQRVQVSTYPPQAIADLAAQPQIIDAWRHEDTEVSKRVE